MNTGISVFSGIHYKKQIECFLKLGIKRTFLLSEEEDFENAIKAFGENGIICESLHAPFNKINDMWKSDEKEARKMLARLKDCVDKCAKFSVPIAVVHLSSGRPMPEINEKGIKRFEELFSYAEEKGVKIAMENQRFFENLSFFMERYQNLGFCWDVGHEYTFTEGIRFMELFGDRAVFTHIHDNRCETDTDDHLLPFDGSIDFNAVAENIVKSGYEGTLMLEVGKSSVIDGKKVYDDLTDDEYIEKAYLAVNKLKRMTEELKNQKAMKKELH